MPNEGNPRLILRLDPLIRTGLQARAMSKGFSLNELAKFVLVEYVKQSAEAKEGTPALLRHLDTLVRTLQLQATALTLPAVEAPGPTKQPLKASKDTQHSAKRRQHVPMPLERNRTHPPLFWTQGEYVPRERGTFSYVMVQLHG